MAETISDETLAEIVGTPPAAVARLELRSGDILAIIYPENRIISPGMALRLSEELERVAPELGGRVLVLNSGPRLVAISSKE